MFNFPAILPRIPVVDKQAVSFLEKVLVYEQGSISVTLETLQGLYKKYVSLDDIYCFLNKNYKAVYENQQTTFDDFLSRDILCNFSLQLPSNKDFYYIETWIQTSKNPSIFINPEPFSFQTEDFYNYLSLKENWVSQVGRIPQKVLVFGGTSFYVVLIEEEKLSSLLSLRKDSPLIIGSSEGVYFHKTR